MANCIIFYGNSDFPYGQKKLKYTNQLLELSKLS